MAPEPEKLTHDRTQTQGEAFLELTAAPAGTGKFTARLGGRTLRDGSRGQIGKPCMLWLPRSSYPRILRRSDIDSRPHPGAAAAAHPAGFCNSTCCAEASDVHVATESPAKNATESVLAIFMFVFFGSAHTQH
jgi:hypothetical protein